MSSFEDSWNSFRNNMNAQIDKLDSRPEDEKSQWRIMLASNMFKLYKELNMKLPSNVLEKLKISSELQEALRLSELSNK